MLVTMKIRKILSLLIIIIIISIIIRIIGGELCFVPTPSMEPTILVGDWLWIDKISYGALLPKKYAEIPILNIFTWIKPLREVDDENFWKSYRLPGLKRPKVGDLIVFYSPENNQTLLIKRISRIISENNPTNAFSEKKYFVEGDNKENSRDSRYFGCISDSLIVGKINVVLFSFRIDTNNKYIFRSNRILYKIR